MMIIGSSGAAAPTCAVYLNSFPGKAVQTATSRRALPPIVTGSGIFVVALSSQNTLPGASVVISSGAVSLLMKTIVSRSLLMIFDTVCPFLLWIWIRSFDTAVSHPSSGCCYSLTPLQLLSQFAELRRGPHQLLGVTQLPRTLDVGKGRRCIAESELRQGDVVVRVDVAVAFGQRDLDGTPRAVLFPQPRCIIRRCRLIDRILRIDGEFPVRELERPAIRGLGVARSGLKELCVGQVAPYHVIAGCEFNGLSEHLLRLAVPAEVIQHGARVRVGRRARLDCQRTLERIRGLVEIAHQEVRAAQVAQGTRVIRCKLGRSLVGRRGLGGPPVRKEKAAVRDVRGGVARLRGDRPAIAALGVIELSAGGQRFGKPDERVGRLRHERERLAVR